MGCPLLSVRHAARHLLHFIVFTAPTALQGRLYLCCVTELETHSDLQFASSHPRSHTEGYPIPQAHALLTIPQGHCLFIAKLGMGLGSSLWVQDKTEEARRVF